MERCLYKGKPLYAFEVKGKFEFEKEIRENSCELFCCDPGCGAPVMYRHGVQRAAHFAHKSNKHNCAYDRYCRSLSAVFRQVRDMMKPVLVRLAEKHGLIIAADQKIQTSPVHYTAFTLTGRNLKIAVDIIDRSIRAMDMEKRRQHYMQNGYKMVQIIVDQLHTTPFQEHEDIYYPVKFSLNTTNNHSAIVVDKDSLQWALYRMDTADYSEVKDETHTLKRVNVFPVGFDLDQLTIMESELTVITVEKQFLAWCNARKDLWERYQQELEQKKIITFSKPASVTHIVPPALPAKAKDEKYELFKQTGKFVGSRVKGKWELFDLYEVKINRDAPNYMKKYSFSDMKAAVEAACRGDKAKLMTLMYKMLYADAEERSYFMKIYEGYCVGKVGDEVRILEYVMRECGMNS